MIRCIYKQKGLYNDKPYYKVGFVQPVSNNGYEGEIPYQISVIKQGSVVRTHNISCTKDVYDYVTVGAEYDEHMLAFNGYGKVIAVYD